MTHEEYRQALAPYLPPPILERAVANYKLVDNDTYGRLLISAAFLWDETPEGWHFWYAVANFVEGVSAELPPLPT